MRSSRFSRFDRELVYYRVGAPRRTAVSLSILFLLGLFFVALTTPSPAASAPGPQPEASLQQ